jgi:hypothetical protein
MVYFAYLAYLCVFFFVFVFNNTHSLTIYTTPVIYLYLERLARWIGRPYRPSRVQEALSDAQRPALAESRHSAE